MDTQLEMANNPDHNGRHSSTALEKPEGCGRSREC